MPPVAGKALQPVCGVEAQSAGGNIAGVRLLPPPPPPLAPPPPHSAVILGTSCANPPHPKLTRISGADHKMTLHNQPHECHSSRAVVP